MDDCANKQIQSMLHHYELGFLSDCDRKEVELHLMECESCLEMVQGFRTEALIMRHDQKIRDEIRSATEHPADESRAKNGVSGWFGSRVKAVSAMAVAAVVLIILIVQPWKLGLGPGQEALAAENRIIVLFFNNIADSEDPQKSGEIITNLLITDLTESSYMQVVSGQRLYDILKLLGHEGNKQIGSDLASEVGVKSGSKWMIWGDILQTNPSFIVSSKIVEVSTGNVIASPRTSGLAGQDIFSVVDQLTVEIKRSLSLPAGAMEELDQRVANVTTHSPEAYRYYLEGVEYASRIHVAEAIGSFEKALTYDSTFAMVYYYLARLKDPSLISIAEKYGNQATQKEQYHIQSCAAATSHDYDSAISLLRQLIERYPDEKDAYYWLGRYHYDTRRFAEAIPYLQLAIDIDPMYKLAYNLLALAYSENDQFEQSVATVNHYISIAPGEANPFDTKGMIYAGTGMFDSAIVAFQTALNLEPDFHFATIQLGHLYALKGEFAKAESLYASVTKIRDKDIQSQGEYYQILLSLRTGRLDHTLHLIQTSAADFGHTRFPEVEAAMHVVRARVFWARSDYDNAHEAFQIAFNTFNQRRSSDSCWNRHIYVQFLAEIGEAARAEEAVDRMANCGVGQRDTISLYWYALGAIELWHGNPDNAVTYFQKVMTKTTYFPAKYMLARAYLESGRYEEAVDLFEELLATFSTWRLLWSLWDVEIYYYLGLANEHLGRYDDAIQNYQSFINTWKNADSDLLQRYDAEERIRLLEKRKPL
jgi:tetratricopeptide (TPR) repeat protein